MRVLVVEDDDRVARGLVTALRHASYDVERVATAGDALRAEPADVVLLDLGLPDTDGMEVLRRLRDHPQTAVIAVTARAEERERVRGLRGGADDYVVKPFGIAELLARIDAVLRRTRAARSQAMHDEPPIRVGPLTIDLAARVVTVAQHDGEHAGDRDGQDTAEPLALTRKEFELLALLAARSPAVVSRDTILDQVWGTTWEPSSRTLDTHIAALRHKLSGEVTIQTARGVGYRLVGDYAADGP